MTATIGKNQVDNNYKNDNNHNDNDNNNNDNDNDNNDNHNDNDNNYNNIQAVAHMIQGNPLANLSKCCYWLAGGLLG